MKNLERSLLCMLVLPGASLNYCAAPIPSLHPAYSLVYVNRWLVTETGGGKEGAQEEDNTRTMGTTDLSRE